MASGASADLSFLAEAARRSIKDLRAAVSAAAPIRAGDRGTHFLEVVGAYLSALEGAVLEREADLLAAKDETERRSVVRAMRLVNHAVIRLHSFTPWIESTRYGGMGLGLVYFVDEIVAALLRVAADVVMTGDATYMHRQCTSRSNVNCPTWASPIQPWSHL